MTPDSDFSDDYQAARRKFLAACEAAGAGVESHQNPHAGPDGAPLFTDVGTIGAPDARAALVLGSGIHGVEGFAGSGIQTGLLSDGLGSHLPRSVRVVMIHAINPYGFAHLRRVNEDLDRPQAVIHQMLENGRCILNVIRKLHLMACDPLRSYT